MNRKPLIVAAIPAFNEERTIAKTVLLARRHVDKVIVCDDGSTDMTGEIAESLGADVIKHGRNLGYGAALRSLFEKARAESADIMVTLDADGQHNPDDIPRLLEPLVSGEADIVIGSRFIGGGGGAPGYRETGIKIITRFTRAGSYEGLTDAQSGFRAYNRRALECVSPTEDGMGASAEILLKACERGLRVKEVPVEIRYDVDRPSTHNPLYHGLTVLLSIVKHMSIRHPLLFYGTPGLLALLIATFFWTWTLQIFTATRQVVTNIALVAIGATIVGLMLLTTAIILWVLVSVVREVR